MNKNFLLVFCFVFSLFLTAQEEKEDLGTQEVTVIKSYTPSLQDVFKLRESPEKIDSLIAPKKAVEYSIFSVPVASTFVPSKGTARKLKPKKQSPQFNSRGSLGFGNFNQLLLEYSTNFMLDRRQKIDWMVFFNGFLKPLEEVQLDSKQNNLLFNVSHQYATSKRNAFSQINFRQHQQSFYGLRNPIEDFILAQFQPQQNLNYLSVSSNWQWYDPAVKELSLVSYLTTDAFGTSEVEVDFSSKFQVLWGGVALSLLPEITYLTTSFKEDFYTRQEVDNATGNARLSFFASKIRGNFKFKLGAKAVMGIGDEFEENNLFIYPELALSYRPQKGNFAPFLKVHGALQQNSFRSFSHENPYVAPAIQLLATNLPLNAEIGTRSKFAAGWEFQWNLFYAQVENQALYQNLGIEIDRTNVVPYRYANAFEVVYTDLQKMGVETQLAAAFKNGGRLQFKARYASFTFDDVTDETMLYEQTAFNLPQLSLQFNGTLKLGQKAYVQWYVNHVGERKNAYRDNFLGQDMRDAPILIEDLAAFTQVDVNLQYQLNERWEVFVKGNNLLNESLYRWANYPVYGTQILVGGRYNFDLAF
ncbi:MAG: hypothetical protein ACPG8F_07395 [Flavobacteriaceae bacterium]